MSRDTGPTRAELISDDYAREYALAKQEETFYADMQRERLIPPATRDSTDPCLSCGAAEVSDFWRLCYACDWAASRKGPEAAAIQQRRAQCIACEREGYGIQHGRAA